MAINLDIQADVVDITTDTPTADDLFFVDTNVWYWLAYTKASSTGARPYQISSYPPYVQSSLSVNALIYYSGLNLAELSHIIEKSEREIYSKTNGLITTKEFRHNLTTERSNVCAEIQIACLQVLSLATSLDSKIDHHESFSAFSNPTLPSVDGYDIFIIQAMNNIGLKQIITDDGDFATINGITVFTANKNIINSARIANKLITR
jgi:hypothetical protein